MLTQTYTNFELIIADDGSEDKTKEAVLAISDPRIRLLELPHTGHISKVRNAGVQAGKGEWVAFLDSDDIWLPDKLQRQMEVLKETSKRWCYGRFELMDEQGVAIPPKAGIYRPISGWITEQLLANEATVIICTLLVERSLFDEAGGFSTDDRLALRGDYEFALRLSIKAEALALPDLLVRVLEHPGRITRSIKDPNERSALPYDIFLEKEQDNKLVRIAKRRKAYLLAEAAVNCSAAGDSRLAWRQLMRSVRNDSWRHWLSACYRTLRATFPGRKPLLKTNSES